MKGDLHVSGLKAKVNNINSNFREETKTHEEWIVSKDIRPKEEKEPKKNQAVMKREGKETLVINTPCKYGPQCYHLAIGGCKFYHKQSHHNYPKFRSRKPCRSGEWCRRPNCAFEHQGRTSYSPLWCNLCGLKCDSKNELDTHVYRKHAKLVSKGISIENELSAEYLVNQDGIPQFQQQLQQHQQRQLQQHQQQQLQQHQQQQPGDHTQQQQSMMKQKIRGPGVHGHPGKKMPGQPGHPGQRTPGYGGYEHEGGHGDPSYQHGYPAGYTINSEQNMSQSHPRQPGQPTGPPGPQGQPGTPNQQKGSPGGPWIPQSRQGVPQGNQHHET